MPTYDLLTEPWIPCLDDQGRRHSYGLRDVLARAHKLRQLQGETPPITAALHRLLLAVLHRVFGPKDMDAWAALWERGSWDMGPLDAYFDQWRHRFDLFHPERPFYQVRDERARPTQVAKLVMHMNLANPTLFAHYTDDGGLALEPAQAAQYVLAAQVYALGGLSGIPEKFTDAPLAKGAVFWVEGRNLFETLALNLIRYPPGDDVMPCSDTDRPAWEMDDPLQPERSIPHGLLDYYTWQNRYLLLLPREEQGRIVVREIIWGPALRLESDIRDPMMVYRPARRSGWQALRFNEDRALWRDSVALFESTLGGDTTRARPPAALPWLRQIRGKALVSKDAWPPRPRLIAAGLARFQQNVAFYGSERLPFHYDYLENRKVVDCLEAALQLAERVYQELCANRSRNPQWWDAARTLARFALVPDADIRTDNRDADPKDIGALINHWGIERRYWAQLDAPFLELVDRIPSEPDAALASWRNVLRGAARRALRAVTRTLAHDPTKLKAVVRAERRLNIGLAKVLGRKEKNVATSPSQPVSQ